MDIGLERADLPADLKKMNRKELNALAAQIRQFLIESVSKTGGHLASNLGVVELTIALHRVFDLPDDKIVFDVGHQSYVHKILTGRKEKFPTLRQEGGFPAFQRRARANMTRLTRGTARRRFRLRSGWRAPAT